MPAYFFTLFTIILISLAPTKVYAQSPTLNGIITMGDSLTAGLAGNGFGSFTCAAQGNRPLTAAQQTLCKGNGVEGVGGWQPQLKQLTQTDVFNHGNSGNQSSEVLARLDGAMANNPATHVLILVGTNDAIFGSTFGAITNIKAMLNQIASAGKTAIIGTVPPLLGSIVAADEPQILDFNRQVRELPNEFEGLVVADLHTALVDNWADNTSGDFIHLGPSGNQIVAAQWNAAIQLTLQPAPEPEPTAFNPAPVSSLLLFADR